VKTAVFTTSVGHREKGFSDILLHTAEMLKPIVGADNTYEIAFITGSGTAANEMVLSGVGSRGPVLVVSNGEFGERLFDIARLHNPEVDCLAFAWQSKIDLDKLENALQSKQYELVTFVHHETSCGILNPIQKITSLAHRYGAIVSVDAISSIGAEKISANEWGVDIIVGASGKALSAMPGVGILIIKKTVVDKLKKNSCGSHYLDLHNHFYFMRKFVQTPNTPAIHVFVSLWASLQEITKFGIDLFQSEIRSRALFTRLEVTRMGLHYLPYEGDNSNVITCIKLPEFLSFAYLADQLRMNNIVVYNGKGSLQDKIFQVGHIGALRKTDTPFALLKLERILKAAKRVGSPSVLVKKSAH